MAYRPLEVTVISAKDLSNVNLFSKMEVYAVATITGEERSKKRTPVDKEGGKNPTWNTALKFTVQEYDLPRAVLHIVLKAERALGDREIGEVRVPLRELFDGWTKAASGSLSGGDDGKRQAPPAQFVSYQVRKHSGKAKGVLNLSYKFGDLVPVPVPPHVNADKTAVYAGGPMTAYPPPAYPPPAGPAYPPPAGPAYPPPAAQNHGDPAQDKANPSIPKGSEPVTAYPAGPSASYPPPGGYPYPPQPGYGYPPQQGYGYPPQQGGYGYPPPPKHGGYGYPPPPQHGGYGYPPPPQQGGYGYGGPVVQPQQGKKNKMGGAGAGLGLGLLGGAVGGLILGDMVSDAVSYDDGYDAGFDDGFGF